MLLEFAAPEGLDPARLMEIYREGNEENAAYFYPGEDKADLRTHEKCGLVVAADPGYDYLQKTTDEDRFGMEYRWKVGDP